MLLPLLAVLLAAQPAPCSRAAARHEILRQNVQIGALTHGRIPVAPEQVDRVICADFTRDGRADMAVTIASGGTAGDIAWLVFVRTPARWRLVLNRSGYKLGLYRLGGDLADSQPVYRKGDPNCCPTGGFDHTRWHWNGTRFVLVRRWHDESYRATQTVLAPCAGSELRVAFAVVPGSAGAGNIVYRLRVRNRSARTCFVSGLPAVRLLDGAGRPLPTHVRAARPGRRAAARIVLRPRGYAAAIARFSPDVPGPGEPAAGRQCERTAYRIRLSARGGGTTTGAISPPTPVCEHGGMTFSVFVAGRRGPASF